MTNWMIGVCEAGGANLHYLRTKTYFTLSLQYDPAPEANVTGIQFLSGWK